MKVQAVWYVVDSHFYRAVICVVLGEYFFNLESDGLGTRLGYGSHSVCVSVSVTALAATQCI